MLTPQGQIDLARTWIDTILFPEKVEHCPALPLRNATRVATSKNQFTVAGAFDVSNQGGVFSTTNNLQCIVHSNTKQMRDFIGITAGAPVDFVPNNQNLNALPYSYIPNSTLPFSVPVQALSDMPSYNPTNTPYYTFNAQVKMDLARFEGNTLYNYGGLMSPIFDEGSSIEILPINPISKKNVGPQFGPANAVYPIKINYTGTTGLNLSGGFMMSGVFPLDLSINMIAFDQNLNQLGSCNWAVNKTYTNLNFVGVSHSAAIAYLAFMFRSNTNDYIDGQLTSYLLWNDISNPSINYKQTGWSANCLRTYSAAFTDEIDAMGVRCIGRSARLTDTSSALVSNGQICAARLPDGCYLSDLPGLDAFLQLSSLPGAYVGAFKEGGYTFRAPPTGPTDLVPQRYETLDVGETYIVATVNQSSGTTPTCVITSCSHYEYSSMNSLYSYEYPSLYYSWYEALMESVSTAPLGSGNPDHIKKLMGSAQKALGVVRKSVNTAANMYNKIPEDMRSEIEKVAAATAKTVVKAIPLGEATVAAAKGTTKVVKKQANKKKGQNSKIGESNAWKAGDNYASGAPSNASSN